MAVARAGLDDGHPRLLHHRPDKTGAAARNKDINETTGVHECPSPLTAGRVNGAHQVGGEVDGVEGLAQDIDNDGVGVLGGAAPAQNDGVTGLNG